MGETCSRVAGRESLEGPGHGLRAVFPAPKLADADGPDWGTNPRAPAAVVISEGCTAGGQPTPSFASTAAGHGTLSYSSSGASRDASFGSQPPPPLPGPETPVLDPLPASPYAAASNMAETVSSPSMSTGPSSDGLGGTPKEVPDTPANTPASALVASSAGREAELSATAEATSASAVAALSSEDTVSSPDLDSASSSSRERLVSQLARVYDQLEADCPKLAYVTGADLSLLRSRGVGSAENFAAMVLEGSLGDDDFKAPTSADLDRRLKEVVQADMETPSSPTSLADGSPWMVVEGRSRFDELRAIFSEKGGAVAALAATAGCSAALLKKNPPADADDFAIKVLRGHYMEG